MSIGEKAQRSWPIIEALNERLFWVLKMNARAQSSIRKTHLHTGFTLAGASPSRMQTASIQRRTASGGFDIVFTEILHCIILYVKVNVYDNFQTYIEFNYCK